MKSRLLKLVPHTVAIVVFLIIASVFFSVISDEYGLNQPDFAKVMGMSKELMDYRMVNNEEALWSNNMFGGMPAYQTNVVYPSNLLRPLDQFLKFYTSPAVGTLFMCMLGFYVLMLCLRVNPWLGIVAAISFGLSTINILYLGGGHSSKVNAISYMAPALGAVILAFRGRWLLGSALFALAFGLHLASNHLQMTYYLAFLIGAVAIGEGVRLLIEKKYGDLGKSTFALLLAGVLGLLPNLGSTLTTYEYSKYTTRGKTELTIAPPGKEGVSQAPEGLNDSYILEYNMSAGEPWAMVIPNAKGGSSSVPLSDNKEAMQKAPRNLRENLAGFPQYWGDQGSSAGAFYFGAGMMFLFALALIFYRDPLRWPFLFITVLSILLCMKDMHAINELFIRKFPMYNKFRDSKMILVLIQIMAPALGVMFIDSLIKNGIQGKARKLLIAGSAALVVVVLIIMASPTTTGALIAQNEVEYFDKMRDQYKSDPRTLNLVDDLEQSVQDVRKVVFVQDAQRSLVIILVMAALVVLVVLGKMKWYLVAGIAAVVVTADMWTVSSRYMNDDKAKNPQTGKLEYIHYTRSEDRIFPYQPDKCDQFILERERTSVEGFEAKSAELEQAMNDRSLYNMFDKKKIHMAAEFGALGLNSDYRVLLANGRVFTDAAMAYFHKSIGGYHAAKLKRYQEMIDFYIGDEIQRITSSFASGNMAVVDSTLAGCNVLNMLNTKYVKYNPEAPPILNDRNALGNAWFVADVVIADDANAEMSTIADINPSKTAIVHKEFSSRVKAPSSLDSSSVISLSQYGSRKLTYVSQSPVEAPVIFSEVYYPEGWVCRIDGTEVPAFRANYFLRGVMVPEGSHTIEWSFEPQSYLRAVTINWIGSALLFVLVFGIFVLHIWKEWKAEVVA